METDYVDNTSDEIAVATPEPEREEVSSIAQTAGDQPPDYGEIMHDMLKAQEARREHSRSEAENRTKQLALFYDEEKKVKSEIKEGKGPSEEKVEEWRREYGHEGEKKLLEFLTKVPVVSVIDWEEHEKELRMPGKVYVARITAFEDFKGKGDFVLSWGNKEWLLVDLTVATDPEILAEKYEKEKNGGPRVLNIGYGTLWNAAQGAEYDQNRVVEAIHSMVIAYREDRLQKNQSRI